MPKQKNAHDKITGPSDNLNIIAERYLDLWQDNIRLWAEDSGALDKWAAKTAQHKKIPDENLP